MSQADAIQADSLAAAQLTLLAFATYFADHDRSFTQRRYSILNGNRGVTAAEAARALASLPKPVRCSAEAGVDDIVVSCKSELNATSDAERQFAANHRRARLALLVTLPKWAEQKPSQSFVTVRGGIDSLVVSVATLRQWCSDYIVAQNQTIQLSDNGDGRRQAGTYTIIGGAEMLRSGHFQHGG